MQQIIWKIDTNTVAVVVQGKISVKSCNNQDFVSWSLISVICINVSSFGPWLELDDLELLLGACGYPCSQLDTPKCNCTGKPLPLLLFSQTDSPILTQTKPLYKNITNPSYITKPKTPKKIRTVRWSFPSAEGSTNHRKKTKRLMLPFRKAPPKRNKMA